MGAAKCPGCGELAGDRVEGLKGQGGTEVILLIFGSAETCTRSSASTYRSPRTSFAPSADEDPGEASR